MLNVKFNVEGKMIKWSKCKLVRAITLTFKHRFQNDLAQLCISAPLRSFTIIDQAMPLALACTSTCASARMACAI